MRMVVVRGSTGHQERETQASLAQHPQSTSSSVSTAIATTPPCAATRSRLSVSSAIALGALWEVAEWTADFFVEKQIVSGLYDTITDLILDSAGALCAALLNLWGFNELSRAENVAKAQGRDQVMNR